MNEENIRNLKVLNAHVIESDDMVMTSFAFLDETKREIEEGENEICDVETGETFADLTLSIEKNYLTILLHENKIDIPYYEEHDGFGNKEGLLKLVEHVRELETIARANGLKQKEV